jgi:Zn-finger nucleic acid-binding protein
MAERCKLTDLFIDQCAHCKGVDITSDEEEALLNSSIVEQILGWNDA